MTDLRQEFTESGYVVLRRLLSPEEAAHYRGEIRALAGIGDADFGSRIFECPDGVTCHRQFWPLITHPRLVTTVRKLIGSSARYTQHSDIHAHRGRVGWHRDSACREYGVGPDWNDSQDDYRVVRVAIYLQSYEESGSRLGVLPGSHRFEQRLSRFERHYWRRAYGLRRRLGLASDGSNPINGLSSHVVIRTRPGGIPYVTPPTLPVWIPTEPGDCIIFNQRLYHSASEIHGPKYAIYLSYGAENEHSRNHLRYYLHHRTDLRYKPPSSQLVGILQRENLNMQPPEPVDQPGFTTVAPAR